MDDLFKGCRDKDVALEREQFIIGNRFSTREAPHLTGLCLVVYCCINVNNL